MLFMRSRRARRRCSCSRKSVSGPCASAIPSRRPSASSIRTCRCRAPICRFGRRWPSMTFCGMCRAPNRRRSRETIKRCTCRCRRPWFVCVWFLSSSTPKSITTFFCVAFCLLVCWIVYARREADYFVDKVIDPSRVCVVDGSKDGYCISSVDDPFLSLLLKDELQVTKDVLAVAVVNHASSRIQIREVIETLGRIRHKKIVNIVFVGIVVRELTEKALFDDLVLPVLTKNVEEYYAVDNGGVMRALMLSDVS